MVSDECTSTLKVHRDRDDSQIGRPKQLVRTPILGDIRWFMKAARARIGVVFHARDARHESGAYQRFMTLGMLSADWRKLFPVRARDWPESSISYV